MFLKILMPEDTYGDYEGNMGRPCQGLKREHLAKPPCCAYERGMAQASSSIASTAVGHTNTRLSLKPNKDQLQLSKMLTIRSD